MGLICQVFRANNHAVIKVSNHFLNNDVSAHMKGMRMLVGYARISTPEQSFDLQVDALEKAGVKDIQRDRQRSQDGKEGVK